MRLKPTKRGLRHVSSAPHGSAFEQEVLLGRVQERIRQLLKLREISQKELAELLNLSAGRVSQILSGENLTLRTLASVGCALGYRFDVTASPINDEAGLGTISGRPPPESSASKYESRLLYETLAGNLAQARFALKQTFPHEGAYAQTDPGPSPWKSPDTIPAFTVHIKHDA